MDTSIQNNEIASRVGGAMKGTDLVFIDTETTGLDPSMHEIIEIGFVRVKQDWNGDKPTFKIIEEWDQKIRPEHIKTADPTSLKINGYTVSEWKNAVTLSEAIKDFSEKTAGAIMVAHNVSFDAGFLDFAFRQCAVQNKMHYHRLDTVSMAYAKLHSIEDVNRFSLGELCKYFEIKNENAHSALSDAKACYELFKKLILL